jgi:hypothetical protein
MDAPVDRFGLTGTTLAGRYRVERQVGEGGFAVVYRASQLALDRPIGVKVLKTPPGLTNAARERFEHRFATEARPTAKLQHPYIVVDVEIACGQHRVDFRRPDLQIAQSESILLTPGQTFKRRYTLPAGVE